MMVPYSINRSTYDADDCRMETTMEEEEKEETNRDSPEVEAAQLATAE